MLQSSQTQIFLVFACIISAIALGLITSRILNRRGHTDRSRSLPTSGGEGSRSPIQTLERQVVNPESPLVELFLGRSGDAPSVVISELRACDLPANKRLVPSSSMKWSALEPLFKVIPSIVTAADFGGGNYMRVVVHGPLAAARESHSFLPFVRGADGKVIELARLQDRRGLCQAVNPAMVSAMVWQFASVIVAQKHLMDISKKLNEIENGVNEIKAFLEDGRQSAIAGDLAYLNQAVQAIMEGEFPDPLGGQLEHAERELLQIEDHLRKDLRTLTGAIAAIEDGNWWSTTGVSQRIEKQQDRIYEMQRQWIFCIRTRAANWQVLSALPGGEHIKSIRKDAILRSVGELTGSIPETDAAMQKKIANTGSIFDRQQTSDQRQAKLQRRHREYRDDISRSADLIRTQVSEVDRLLSLQPIVLALKVEQGRVLETYEIDEPGVAEAVDVLA